MSSLFPLAKNISKDVSFLMVLLACVFKLAFTCPTGQGWGTADMDSFEVHDKCNSSSDFVFASS